LKNSKLNASEGTDSLAKPLRSVAVDSHRIDSRDLFVGTRELTIAHGDDVYRLRLTSQNKLILTK